MIYVDEEEALRVHTSLRLEENLENLVSQLGSGLFMVDRNFRIIWSSEKLAEVLGLDESPLEKVCSDIFSCGEGETSECVLRNVFNTNEPQEMEPVYARKFGRDRMFKFIVAPLSHGEGLVSQAMVLVLDISRARMIESDLRTTLNKYSALLANATDGICVFDGEGKISYANPRLRGMCAGGRLEGRNIGEFVKGEALRSLRDRIDPQKPGAGLLIETDLTTAEDEKRPVKITVVPLSGSSGGLEEWVATFEDISESVRTQSELRSLRDLNERVLQNLPNGILVVDSDFRILYSNDTVREMGIVPRYAAPKTVDLFAEGSPFLMVGIEHLYRTIIESSEPMKLSGWRFKDGTGLERNLNFTLIPVRVGGKVEQIINAIEDVTALKRAEHQLRESEQRYRSLVENTTDGIAALVEDRFQFANGAFLRMFGFDDLTEVVNKDVTLVVAPGDRERFRNHYGSLMRGETASVQFECGGMLKNGSIIEVEAVLKTVESDGHLSVQCTFRDITKRKDLERGMMASKEEAEFYTDLMAHDINNFNQGALGYLELVLQTCDVEGRTSQYLKNALSQVKATTQLISRVRKLTRIRADDNPEFTRKDLVLEVLDVLDSIPSQITGRKLNIRCNSQASRYHSMIDDLFEDLMVNIITNAIKYDESEGAVDVEVTVEKGVVSSRPNNVIKVTDHGPGIPDSKKKDVFRRFERGSRGIGSGLGLSIVSAIVRRYGGKVWVEDRVVGDHTRGSVFIVALPEA